MQTLRRWFPFLILVSFSLALTSALTGCGTSGGAGNSGGSHNNGPEVLYAVPSTALLNTFMTATINSNTGGFSSTSITTIPLLSSGGVVATNAEFLYVSGSGEILGYSLDPTTGIATPLTESPFTMGIDSAHGMAAAPTGNFFYVADTDRIDAFTVDNATGVPTPIAQSPFASGNNQQLVVDPSGKFLYASDDDPPGGILAFSIGSDGSLTPLANSPFAIPGQAGANSQPFGIVDNGKFVYTALFGSNQIAAFSIDSGTGALTPVPGSPFASGVNPAVLALSNNFLYAVNELDGSISGYSINSTTGALTPVPDSPFISDSATLTADPSEKYLYVSLSAGILGFDIDPSTGALTQQVESISNDGSLWMTIVQFPSPSSSQ